MQKVKVLEIPRFRDAAYRLEDWFDSNYPTISPKFYEAREPGTGYRRCVGWIDYESSFEDLWGETLFKEGIVAFTLIALEKDGWVTLWQNGKGQLQLYFKSGRKMTVEEFESGELFADMKCDPEFADLDWRCVSIMADCLDEFPYYTDTSSDH